MGKRKTLQLCQGHSKFKSGSNQAQLLQTPFVDTVRISNDGIRYNERARNHEFRAILALSFQGDTRRHKLSSFILLSAPDSVTQPCNLITCG